MMSNNDNDMNIRRLQSLMGVIQNTPSEISSPIPVLTHKQPQVLQQQQTEKKTKCRGNRKIQRYRRQLYAKGLDSKTVNELVEERLHYQQQQQEVGETSISNMEVYIPLDRVRI